MEECNLAYVVAYFLNKNMVYVWRWMCEVKKPKVLIFGIMF